MPSFSKIRLIGVLLVSLLVASACEEGQLRTYVNAKSPYDVWTQTDEHWDDIAANIDSMVVWDPYWDSRLDSFDEVTLYRDAYAIKVVANSKDRRAVDHPEWILRDAEGEPVYIPFACATGCPQYAADLGNPAFVADWIADVRVAADRGYTGLFIDDVNLLWRFGDVTGATVVPVDPRTGEPMTRFAWKKYMVEFLEEVRAAFPDLEIWHNSIWYYDSPTFTDYWVNRQIEAADVVHLERGFNDRGLVDGPRKFGVQTFMNFIDRVHERGSQVALLGENGAGTQGLWFNIAGALLVNNGGDFVSTEDWAMIDPTDFFGGFSVDLGAALGPREVIDGTIQREFAEGLVIMNEPRRDPVTVQLDGSWLTPTGQRVTQVSLDGREAIVLRRP